jgi:RecA/RadA recombinase
MITFNIVNELNLADKRALIVELKDAIRVDMMAARVAKAKAKEIKKIARENKAYDRAAKKAARIAKLEAKLASLKNPVGIKAVKANKKPSNVSVMKMAA